MLSSRLVSTGHVPCRRTQLSVHRFLWALQEQVAQCGSSSLLLTGAYSWAQTTLKLHAKDKRPFLYSLQELEQGTTHDPLWNAAQVVPHISPPKC